MVETAVRVVGSTAPRRAVAGSAVAGSAVARRPGPVRLTRRGQLALLTVLLAVATGLAGLVAAPGQAADRPGVVPTMVVRPGDTLWSVANRYAPDRDPFETIDAIRRLNGIDGYTVHPGERLAMPSRH